VTYLSHESLSAAVDQDLEVFQKIGPEDGLCHPGNGECSSEMISSLVQRDRELYSAVHVDGSTISGAEVLR